MFARMKSRSTHSQAVTRRSFLRGGAALATFMLAGASRCGTRRAGPRDEQILVIGAGIAGIAAARGLKAAGFPVRVIEGRDRVGGRIWTDRSLGAPVDLGASWIHGDSSSNPIRVIASELGVRTMPTDHDDLRIYDHTGARMSDARFEELYEKTEEVFRSLYKAAEDLHQDIGIGAALNQVLAESELSADERMVLNWTVSELEVTFAGDFSEISLREDEEEDVFGDEDSLFPDGYDAIVKGLAGGLDVQTGTRVRVIHHSASGVRVETDRGEIRGDGAVVTLPLGVLRAGGVRFSPPLPEPKQAAIRRLSTGTLNKTVLRYPRAFWPVDRDYIGHISKRKGEWGAFLDLQKINGRPMLMNLAGGDVGRGLERKSESALRRETDAVLAKIFGKDAVPADAILRTKWTADPFAYSSYSIFAKGARGADYDALAEPAGRLFFAGEATMRRYPATVHGAYLSGVREAERIADL